MMTGLHTVKDISCKNCRKQLGWTYVKAFEPSQKYKEGSFILERAFVSKVTFNEPELLNESDIEFDELSEKDEESSEDDEYGSTVAGTVRATSARSRGYSGAALDNQSN
mmetsp:Transcript_22172/g.34323  ORF Transcript_22172/g.34323 Transcript_22172/m.34323 type:complete len:109 (+) Transcript_22172:356-682(+)